MHGTEAILVLTVWALSVLNTALGHSTCLDLYREERNAGAKADDRPRDRLHEPVCSFTLFKIFEAGAQ